MMALSVISRQKPVRGTPYRSSKASILRGKSKSIRSRVDRLMAMRKLPPAGCSFFHSRAAASSIHRVKNRTKPVCSANGMNCMGCTMPLTG